MKSCINCGADFAVSERQYNCAYCEAPICEACIDTHEMYYCEGSV